MAIAMALAGVALPAAAVEIGEPNLRSALGERLLVEVPIRASTPLPAGCVSARLGRVGDTPRAPGQRQLPGGLVISTPRIVSEPMLELSVNVNCPGVARLSREFTLFLNPAGLDSTRPASVLRTAQTGRSPTRAATPVRPTPGKRPAIASAATARRYRVQTGDTVSGIAAALTPRGQSYWPVVDDIVATNPQAFVDGDPDRLIAGALLVLPVTDAAPNAPTRRASTTQPADADSAPAEASPAPGIANPGERASAIAPTTVTTPAASPTARAEVSTSTRTETDRLLNVLGAAATDRVNAADESPFVDETRAADAEPAPGVVPLPAISSAPASPWTGRLLGLGAGMLLALGIYALWPSQKRKPRRRTGAAVDPIAVAQTALPDTVRMPKASTAPSISAAPPTTTADTPQPMRDLPPISTDMFETQDDLVPSQTESFSFHTPGDDTGERTRPLPITSPGTISTDIKVGTLTSHQVDDIVSDLDDQTQQMLEADYEAELTMTQQLAKADAERALAEGADAEHDVTIEMHGYHNAGDTMLMPPEETGGFRDATVARYVGQPEDTVAETEEMPSLDLDLDMQSASMILDASAKALGETLGEDLDVDVEDMARKKQA